MKRPLAHTLLICSPLLAIWPAAPLAAEETQTAESAKSDSAVPPLTMIEAVNLLPAAYRPDAVKSLGAAEQNQSELIVAIQRTPIAQREAMAYLIAHMPPEDLTKLKADFLLENVDYACRARQTAAWGKNLPDELFFEYVLPYANLNERRDNYRKDFHDKFLPAVQNCRTPGEACLALNKAVFADLNVKYHPTKRPKPDQSPYESTQAGYASCTGLSILLVDACRAVGVPARVVGTQWTKTPGNHTWIEVWDRQWNYLGASEIGELNQTWFAGNASQADGSKLPTRIHAACFAPTGTYFPLLWAPDNKDVAALDVTPFYTRRSHVTVNIVDKTGPLAGGELTIRHKGHIVAADVGASKFKFDLARGEKYSAEFKVGNEPQIVREFEIRAEGSSDITLDSIGREISVR